MCCATPQRPSWRELRDITGGSIAWPLDEAMPLSADEQAARSSKAPCSAPTTRARGRPIRARARTCRASCSSRTRTSRTAVRRAETAAPWANRARDLVNRPANDLTPESFAEYAASIADGTDGLSAEALGPDEMRDARHGRVARRRRGQLQRAAPDRPALGAADAGGRRTSCSGSSARAMTFDSGGISLKPATHMEDMKGDMAGAAAVVAGIGAIARARGPGSRDRRRGGRREHAERPEHAARRHPHGRQRQDDRGHEHRRRRAPRARRRALVRARAGRDARRRLRDADRARCRSRSATSTPGSSRTTTTGATRSWPRARRAATTSGRSRSIRATGGSSTRRSRT